MKFSQVLEYKTQTQISPHQIQAQISHSQIQPTNSSINPTKSTPNNHLKSRLKKIKTPKPIRLERERRSSMACGSTAKLQAACGGVSGWRWTLASWVLHIRGQRRDLWRWFHEPPVDGKSVMTRGSMATSVVARVFTMEIKFLGFANRRPKKRFVMSISWKDGEKLADLKGGSNWWCDGCGFFFFVC